MDYRQFFVKSDNISIPNELKGTQVLNILKPGSIEDLKDAIRERYRFPKQFDFQLWTGTLGMKGKRFDDVDTTIDSSIQTVFMKVPIFSRLRQHTLPIDELDWK